ncbi:hypothetical protein [Paenirhodobacter sp.]|uniref:hypothetical protein n=1 Tax=Paenirhodobacter sp. TaxID=1965326 RepID=UPI003B3F47B5
MLDISNLRPDPAALRTPFEGLICGLARRFPPDERATFSWIAGSGGDGGLEAYWTTPAGDEVGYQAKFYRSSGEVDWSKINASVSAALTSHPRLTCYVVALACDLTDEVPGRRGKSGRAHWKHHKAKWEADASAHDMSVAFELWDLSEIEDRLTQPCARGLRSYWLGELELTKQWFFDAFGRTAAALDERYQPDDHVEVAAEQTFGGLLRDERLDRRLRAALKALHTNELETPHEAPREVLSAIDPVRGAINAIQTFDPIIVIPKVPTMPMALGPLRECLDALQTAGRVALDAITAHYPKVGNGRDPSMDATRHRYDKAYGGLRSVLDEAQEVEALLSSSAVRADAARFVLVTGRAGTGKSHILAAEVDRLTKGGAPAIMLLGTWFSDGSLVGQIPNALGLDATWDAFLDAMNAAAEAVGARGLVAIDAINEGGGRRWRDELGALALDVTRRPWLAFAVSCRTEYEPYLITDGARERAAHLFIEGFATEEEQERAAQVYLDGRGILRPATPWLPPEFVNPLFLRTTANALQEAGRSEYPTGLHGTKEVLRFYLDVAGRHLGTEQDGSHVLVRPTARAVTSIAKEMAKTRQDHLLLSEARRLADAAFASHQAPMGMSWFDVLHRRGILRLDPPAQVDETDPLDVLEDVVRFAFQRFGDHLVAEALLDQVTPSASAFEEGGALAFLIERHRDHAWLSWEWSGVFQALWIAHAERNGGELVDTLPKKIEGLRVDEFIETIYWRSSEAFTDRTLDLFNRWVVQDEDYMPARHLQVLLRLSLRDHVWNVEFLDRNLRDRPMPERDAFWTLPLAQLGRYGVEHSEAHRLAHWCNGPAVERASDDVLARALILLGWFFTATDRVLRDMATKGATHILLSRPALLPAFIRRFAGTDDPYVLERVAAASAGACLRDPTSERLTTAGEAIYDAFFKDSPPVHMLTRDYARLIVELAHDRTDLHSKIEIERCRPPYGAEAPSWPASKEEVEARVETVGAKAILSSCAGWGGDFGRYVIKGRVEEFSTIPLEAAPPLVPAEAGWSERYDLKRRSLQNTERACLWVADRARSLGWTSDLFPKDATISEDRHRGGRIERIGKKYQWIALHELLARLADNFWIIDEYRSPTFHRYDTPNDVPYVRDIEVSMPPLDERSLPPAAEISVAPLEVHVVPEDAWADWAFDDVFPITRMHQGSLTGVGSDDWCILYRYDSARTSWPEGQWAKLGIQTRQEEFWFQMMIGLPTGQAAAATTAWKRRKIDFHDWLPENRTDRGYIYELDRRGTWDDGRQGPERGRSDGPDAFRQFTVGYHWESHLDRSMPTGLEFQVPSAWLVRALQLNPNPSRPGVFENSDGRAVIVCGCGGDSILCAVRREEIDTLLASEGLDPMWIGIGERSTYPREGSGARFHRRRWNGILLPSQLSAPVSFWVEDHSHSD